MFIYIYLKYNFYKNYKLNYIYMLIKVWNQKKMK